MEHRTELNLKSVFREGITIYKVNFKAFFILAFISFLISMYGQSYTYLKYIISNEILYYCINILNNILILYLSVYISTRLSIAIYILARSFYDNNALSAKQAYKESKPYFGTFLGNTMLVWLTFLIPMLAIIYSQMRIQDLVLKYLVYFIAIIPLAYLSTKYSFVPLTVILENSKLERFSYSSKLVKGSFFLVFCAFFLSGYIFHLPYYTLLFGGFLKSQSELIRYLVSSANLIITMFVLPFTCCIDVILYNKLRDLKIYNK